MPRDGRRPRRPGEEGSLAILSAGLLLAAFAILAMVVDLGYMHARQRGLQGAVDAAAMAVVQDPSGGEARAREILAANGFAEPDLQVTVRDGDYRACVEDAAAYGQVAEACNGAESGILGQAITVEASASSPLFFGGIVTSLSGLRVTATGTAARTELLAITAGTRVASVDAGLLNDLLTVLTGSSISLTALGYEALLDTRVDLLAVLGRYAANAGLGPATFVDLLGMQVPLADLVASAADVLGEADEITGSAAQAIQALASLEASLSGTTSLALDRLLGFDEDHGNRPAGPMSGLAAEIPAIDLVMLAARASRDGPTMLPVGLNLSALGLAGVQVDVLLGEPVATILVGRAAGTDREPARLYTAQARIRIRLLIDLGIPLIGDLVDLPIYVFLGEGVAEIDGFSCEAEGPGAAVATVEALPGLARAVIGQIGAADFTGSGEAPMPTGPATVLNIANLIGITASAGPVVTGSEWHAVPFTLGQIQSAQTQTVSSGLALDGLLDSLLSDLDLQVTLPGGLLGNVLTLTLGLTSGAIEAMLATRVSAALAVLGPQLDLLLRRLGVGLGEMDLTAFGLRCMRPALVR